MGEIWRWTPACAGVTGSLGASPLAIRRETPDILAMRNIVSIIIGLFALLLVIPAFIPLLGWANWIIIPIAVVGLAIGAMSDRTSGRNLNAVVILVGVGRLMLGGGII
jgi:hypothetical protein